jgi:hypothetical protein
MGLRTVANSSYAAAGVFFHPPLICSESSKRNEYTLLFHVVGEEETPTTA